MENIKKKKKKTWGRQIKLNLKEVYSRIITLDDRTYNFIKFKTENKENNLETLKGSFGILNPHICSFK